jgi:hypothetical protein
MYKGFKKVKEILFKIITIFLSFIISLLIGEILIRFLYPQLIGKWSERASFYIYDPLLGWKGKPNASGNFERINFNVEIQNNSLGFRGDEYSYSKTPNTKRILVLGDSYVWGYGVKKNEIFTSLMKKKLNNTEILNMGCSGYGNDQELLLLKSEGIKCDPDLVVVVVTLPSDFFNNIHSVQYSYPKPYFIIENDTLSLHNIPVPKQNLFQRIGNYLTNKSALFVYLKFLQPKSQKVNSNEVGITYEMLKEINRLCQINGIKVLFVINPTIDLKTNEPYRAIDKDKLLLLLESENFNVIDLSNLFDIYLQKNNEKLTFEFDAHWNENGHKLVSKVLLDFLDNESNQN